MIKLLRYAIARWFIHVGLNVMPKGKTHDLICGKLREANRVIQNATRS